jgi:hypothetical protein
MHTVKFAEGSDTIIEGLAIPYGGPLNGKDLHGEDFGPDTDIVPDLYPDGRPLIYNHGTNKDMDLIVQGRQTTHETRDEGIWAQAELDKRARYHATVAKMIRNGQLSFSSGAIPHLVKTNADGHIVRWPWQELSLTPTPANPDAVVTFAVKSAEHIDHLAAAGIEPTTDLIKTIIGEDDPEHESFAGHAERVTALVDAFAGRSLSRYDARVKAGRALSAANRAEIEEVIAALDGVVERRAALVELLARTGPQSEETKKAIEAAYIDFIAEQSRAVGALT